MLCLGRAPETEDVHFCVGAQRSIQAGPVGGKQVTTGDNAEELPVIVYAMIGPSAPNGLPLPMATAADSGFRNMGRGGIMLCPCSTRSITSGIPWPRIAFEP
jgi:hypothetical protein